MSKRTHSMLAAAIILISPAAGFAYFTPSSTFSELSWTFPITPGGFIGGMDTRPGPDQAPVVAFSESGTVYEMRGGVISPLVEASTPVFSSFVVADSTRGVYLHAESSSGGIWQIGFDGTGASYLGSDPLAYDAAVDPRGRLFLTRADSYSGPSQLVCFDPATQTMAAIAVFPGPTGPLACDAQGNLYYGTSAPQFGQIGGQSIYKITAAQADAVLSGAPALTPGDLTAIIEDIDSPSDILALPGGRLLFTSSVRSPGRIMQVQDTALSVYAVLESSRLFLTTLSYSSGSVFVNVGGVFGADWSPYGAIAQLVPEPCSLVCLASLLAPGLLTLRLRSGHASQQRDGT